MMNIGRLLVVLCLAASCHAVRTIKLDKIGVEIKALNFPQVEVLLGKLHRIKNLTHKETKQVFADLHDMAADIADEYYEAKSIRRSWKDAGMTLGGTIGMGLGLAVALVGPYQYKDPEEAKMKCRIGGGLTALASCYVLYKGLTCTTQKGWIEQVKDMQKYFDKKYSDLEVSQEPVSTNETQ